MSQEIETLRESFRANFNTTDGMIAFATIPSPR